MDQISNTYYNAETGYINSASKLLKKIQQTHPNVKLHDVKQFLANQYAVQINKTVRKPKVYRSIISPSPRNNYQMDIIVYDRFEYNKHKYILCVIDVYSRYVSCRALTNRTNVTILENIKSIFEEMGLPKNLNCDNEFNKSTLNTYFKGNNITTHYSQPDEINKNAIVERFNRTLASLIQNWRSATSKYDWAKILPLLVANYNNTYHSTIKETPSNVFNSLAKSKQKIIRIQSNLKLDDVVRIIHKKLIFSKGDAIRNSVDTYTIVDIVGNKFELMNNSTNRKLKHLYKDYELLRINTVNRIPDQTVEQVIHTKAKVKRKVSKLNDRAHVNPSNVITTRRVKNVKTNITSSPYILKQILDYDADSDMYKIWFMGYSKAAANWEHANVLERYANWKSILEQYNKQQQ